MKPVSERMPTNIDNAPWIERIFDAALASGCSTDLQRFARPTRSVLPLPSHLG